MTAVTLVEFLTARLDEDEAAVEARIAGELDSLHQDGMPHVTRQDLLTTKRRDGEVTCDRRLARRCPCARQHLRRPSRLRRDFYPCDPETFERRWQAVKVSDIRRDLENARALARTYMPPR